MHKFRNKPTKGYASKREHKRALELKLMQSAKQIRNLREQVPYLLIPKQEGERSCTYVADFVYEVWPDWKETVEDSKGFRTDVYRIKKKLMKFIHGITIQET